MDVFAELPRGPFEVLLVDPPWSYTGQQDKWGAAAKFYPTLSLQQIKTLPIQSILAKRAVVFCWTTGPQLRTSIRLLRAWGLHYRSVGFVWVKTKQDGTPIGAQGVRPSVTKQLTEFVLTASNVREGRPLKLSDESIVQTVFAPKQEHSQKPESVQDRIDRMYPDARKIELFARRERAGWTCWGNEITAKES